MSNSVDNASSTLLDIVKLSPKYLLGIIIFTGSILLIGLNDNLMSFFGIKESLFENIKIWDSIVFLLSTSLIIAHIITVFSSTIKNNIVQKNAIRYRKKRLEELTLEEKQILSTYIFHKTRTQLLDITDGTVKELEFTKIIFRASNMSQEGIYFAYNIQPWAWNYLMKNKHLVEVCIDELPY